jgi:hypothetical protein
LKHQNKHVLIRKFNPTSNEKNNYHHPTFVQYKKSFINLFSLYQYEKKLNKKKAKKQKRQKHKIGNIWRPSQT